MASDTLDLYLDVSLEPDMHATWGWQIKAMPIKLREPSKSSTMIDLPMEIDIHDVSILIRHI